MNIVLKLKQTFFIIQLNGQQTQDENTEDNGGLKEAFFVCFSLRSFRLQSINFRSLSKIDSNSSKC